jgi:hypothetical protein
MRAFLLSFFLLLAPLMLRMGFAQVNHEVSTEKLGTVSFSTSCSAVREASFNRAVALMHSFQFAGAIEEFHGILAADPSCSMAYWGIALSSWGNPFAPDLKPRAQLEQGFQAVTQARAAQPQTARERAYVEAVAHLYTDTANTGQRSRVLAYERAMGAVSAAYPKDTEALIFYALAIAAAADPADKTYARQRKAGHILDSLYAKYPNHPGLAHYIIHAYDVPPLAARAANAAQHYSEIAPSTPHALHMPSHTFTRLGEWQASIDANVASAASARKAAQPADELHASDYLIYAYLQTAQDLAARRVVDSAVQAFSHFDPNVLIAGASSPAVAYFAQAAIPARYTLERQAWAEAARLEVTPSPYPQTEAITYFARGVGAAHAGDRSTTRAAIDALQKCRERLKEQNELYWANQVEIQRQEVVAWLAFAEGKQQVALADLRAAAAMEDSTEKSAVTPGPLAPAREQLGELLLALNRPSESHQEFQSTLVKEPNRFRSLYGAAEAAKLAGDSETEQIYFRKLLEVAAGTDQPGRQELAEARIESKRAP